MSTEVKPAVGDIITHRDGWQGRIIAFSPDGTIVDVVNLLTQRKSSCALATFDLSESQKDGARAPAPTPAPAYPSNQPLKLAMGPIIGAILIANLISGVVGAILMILFRSIR